MGGEVVRGQPWRTTHARGMAYTAFSTLTMSAFLTTAFLSAMSGIWATFTRETRKLSLKTGGISKSYISTAL